MTMLIANYRQNLSARIMPRSRYASERSSYRPANESPPRYYNREFGRQDSAEDRHSDEEDSVKPYTAVGATLDSAERFKRRMNYGRVTPRM